MRAALLALSFLQPQSPGSEDFVGVFHRALELSRQGKDLESLEALRIAERLAPEDPWVHFNRGILLSRNGHTASALESFRRAAALAPQEARLHQALGEALYRAGRVEEAVPVLEKAAASTEPLAPSLVLLAAAYEALGRREQSLAALSRYLELSPQDAGARLQLGHQLASAGRGGEALDIWKRGVDLASSEAASETAPSLHSELCFRVAELLARDAQRAAEAEPYLKKALAVEPSHLGARLLAARLRVRAGLPEEALEEIDRALRSKPDSPEALFARAGVLQQLGRTEEADLARGRFQELSRAAEHRESQEQRLKASYKRARELLDAGRMSEAEAEFKATLEIDPDNAQVQSILAKIAYSAGRLAEARERIASAMAREGSVAEYPYLAALFAARAGEAREAEQAVRRSLEISPTFADGWILLGSLLADTKRAEEAVACFRKAEVLEPASPAIQLNLAAAYHVLGNLELEQQAMERYRALSSLEMRR
jgi:tetratricopeptide (TPR) repeat protein